MAHSLNEPNEVENARGDEKKEVDERVPSPKTKVGQNDTNEDMDQIDVDAINTQALKWIEQQLGSDIHFIALERQYLTESGIDVKRALNCLAGCCTFCLYCPCCFQCQCGCHQGPKYKSIMDTNNKAEDYMKELRKALEKTRDKEYANFSDSNLEAGLQKINWHSYLDERVDLLEMDTWSKLRDKLQFWSKDRFEGVTHVLAALAIVQTLGIVALVAAVLDRCGRNNKHLVQLMLLTMTAYATSMGLYLFLKMFALIRNCFDPFAREYQPNGWKLHSLATYTVISNRVYVFSYFGLFAYSISTIVYFVLFMETLFESVEFRIGTTNCTNS